VVSIFRFWATAFSPRAVSPAATVHHEQWLPARPSLLVISKVWEITTNLHSKFVNKTAWGVKNLLLSRTIFKIPANKNKVINHRKTQHNKRWFCVSSCIEPSDIHCPDTSSSDRDASPLSWKINFHKNEINKSAIYYKTNIIDNCISTLMLADSKLLATNCWHLDIYLSYSSLSVVDAGPKSRKHELARQPSRLHTQAGSKPTKRHTDGFLAANFG